MTHCETVRERLNEWVDGELSGDPLSPEAERIAEHLAECAPCRSAESSLRNVKLLVQSKADRPDLPPDLRARVELALGEAREQHDLRFGWIRSPWVRSAAAILLLAALITGYSFWGPTPANEVAHATVAEETLAQHCAAVGAPRWRVQTADDVRAVIARELGVESPRLPVQLERLRFHGARPITIGEARGVRVCCEFDGKPFSIFALDTLPKEVRAGRASCCICTENPSHLVACWASEGLYLSFVGTGVTRGEFVAKLQVK